MYRKYRYQTILFSSIQFNVLFQLYFCNSLFRSMSANFEGISPLSVWLWLQNFNSKPNMLIYLWTKAWISQFVACHLGRGQRRNVLMNLKSGLHSSNGTKIEFYWNTHFIFYQNLLKYLLISFLAHSRFYEKRQVTI